jgi:ketosteroid isomerase-like protein
MATGNGKSADEAAVRAVVDAIVKAVRAKDVEAMLAQCAPELVTFDMVPPNTSRCRSTWRPARHCPS